MLNCVTLMGRLTADPVLKTTTTGKEVCQFSIAVDRSYAGHGEKQSDFITIVAWEAAARFVVNYFTKGSMIALTGSIQTRTYEDKTGAKRTAFEVLAREVSFTGSRSETGSTAPAYPQAAAASAPAPSFQTAAAGDFEEISDEEDLPF